LGWWDEYLTQSEYLQGVEGWLPNCDISCMFLKGQREMIQGKMLGNNEV